MVLINVDQCIIWDIVLAVGIKLKKINHPSQHRPVTFSSDQNVPKTTRLVAKRPGLATPANYVPPNLARTKQKILDICVVWHLVTTDGLLLKS